jgi:hypothetical protein
VAPPADDILLLGRQLSKYRFGLTVEKFDKTQTKLYESIRAAVSVIRKIVWLAEKLHAILFSGRRSTQRHCTKFSREKSFRNAK